jgi:hypothetical protein
LNADRAPQLKANVMRLLQGKAFMIKSLAITQLLLVSALASQVCLTQTPASKTRSSVESKQEWKEYSLPNGQFIIKMPAKPISQSVPLDSKAGGLVAHIIALDTQLESYGVTYIEFPDRLDDPAKGKAVLDGIRDKELVKVGGKLLREADISIDSYPGRELTIEVPDGFWVDRIYLIRKRLYAVSAFTSKARPDAKDITEAQKAIICKYLDSFKLKLEPSE